MRNKNKTTDKQLSNLFKLGVKASRLKELGIKESLQALDTLLDVCPKCGSDNIANENENETELTCHDCSYQWTEEAG